MQQNRLGLGLRPPLPSYGQGPSLSALAYQQQIQNMPPPPKTISLFVGSISGGITDQFMNQLLAACGPIKPFKRLITPANKPQGFGFVEYDDPVGAWRALALLNGVELPALEDGCANKKLLVKADDKYKPVLDGVQTNYLSSEAEEAKTKEIKARIDEFLVGINQLSQDAANSGLIDKEKYLIPPHLHDLQEADLPETQRGLVISEIAQFRERAAKREREKMRDVRESIPSLINAPSGPKAREWGKPQGSQNTASPSKHKGAPAGFVKAGDGGRETSVEPQSTKTDAELEAERKEKRRQEEELSFKDRERRYEPREKARIQALERAIARERAQREQEERDRVEYKVRLDAWDDDESDEVFYVDRARWRQQRRRRLEAEEAADDKARRYEEQEAENLRRESEDFLARQMDEMQALAEEQRKAGMLLDDGAPVRLNVSIAHGNIKEKDIAPKEKTTLFAQDEEEEESIKKRKVPLVKLDFSVAESSEQMQERLERIKESVPRDKEILFKSKVRWDGLTDLLIDRKLEPLVKKLMVKYLGELEDDDLILFVLEHLKDHKTPQKLVEGLEPVLEEEAVEFAISLWRQVIFESMAYNEGLMTDKMLIE